MNRLLYTLLILSACSPRVWAEDDNTSQQRDTPAQTSPAGNEQPENAAAAPETKTLTPETFTPSEEISEDLSVSYPVDI